ncbi:Peptidase U61, LD-carboxypeptidase A [Parvularcula bermudensis HTCC2503]|uniref:Peptidase U61, LD-carboxypeptidase A n=1 Tax=Parvularcula bermudensis (strain ATCC BAA-594 / HTCC2503 / KCTC 12087) TaxID=314260 RepID=E0TE43_PARBH|nr:LD-carboxypeptidase [Parvularcula bermudensis]ADM08864.1 Peptidase U61, LD-carboxypeptidase A [Parvularcula bermudensis HTCC2503]
MAEARARPLTVRAVAPARWLEPEVLDDFIALAAAQGGRVLTPAALSLRDHQLCGTDEERAAALIAAFDDPEADILWCVRGGYGSARLLPYVHKALATGKIVIGYSDMTALFVGTGADGPRAPFLAVHGPMPVDLLKPEGAARLVAAIDMARTARDTGRWPGCDWRGGGVRAGQGRGRLIVGNLTVLLSLLGTPYEPQPREPVLLAIEDCGEYHYALDRALVQLAQSRFGKALAGIVLGDFTDLEDNPVPWGEGVAAMAHRHFPDLPIAHGFPVGHGLENSPFALGAAAQLVVEGEAAHLTIADTPLPLAP